jgi:ATP-binding cassette subfamily F protein uup
VEGGGPAPDRPGSLDLGAPAGRDRGTPRLGDKVVTLKAAGHRFGTGPWLFRDLDLALEPRGRLGVVGPNGSGKSTLLDVLAGRLQPAAGTVEVGTTVRLGRYGQASLDLDPGLRVRDAVAGPIGPPSWDQVRLMERFWFDADAQWATVGTLSGGERRRLQLLLVLAGRPNVLLLDEPTNDLDLDTLRALEDHLEGWPGSLVMVSHDRALLERSVTDVLVLDGSGGAALVPAGSRWYQAAGPPSMAAATATATAGAVAPRPPRSGAVPGAKRRSPSTLRRLIGVAERDMAEAADARDRLAAELGTGGANHVALGATAHALAEAEARLAAAEERWLALSEELGA